MTESTHEADGDKKVFASDGARTVNFGLIVEDLPDAREWLVAVMAEAFPGVVINTAATLAEARQQIGLQLPQIALIDIGLPDGSGIDLIGELNVNHHSVTSVVVPIGSCCTEV